MPKKLTKNRKNVLKKYDYSKAYPPHDAIEIVKKIALEKFDSPLDVAIKLGIDPKQSDQQLRGSYLLPHGSGKSPRILVVCENQDQEVAQKAGADYVGCDDVIEKIRVKKWLDFDVVITTPSTMKKLAMIGKILGPKGLMPNPKTGTITNDLAKTIKEVKAGKIEYKNDKEGNVHASIGKLSFTTKQLEENFVAFVDLIKKVKPHKAKGKYIHSITISSTMGVGIKIESSIY